MGEETPLRQGEKEQEAQEVKIYRRKAGMKKLVNLVSWLVTGALVVAGVIAAIAVAIALAGLLLASAWWCFLLGWDTIS
jgi:hypothetical protein